jgi:hypothetical protein
MVLMFSSKFPGFDKLYSIGSKGSSREFIADINFGSEDPIAVTRGEQPVKTARAQWAMGMTRPGEVVWTRLIGPVLLGPILIESLEQAGTSGLATYPVELMGKNNEKLGTYFGLVVTGRCGAIDPTRCVQTTKDYPAGPFPVLQGLFFEEASWDGSDVFMPEDDTAWIFVTKKVKDILSKKAKNIRFDALTNVEQMPTL